MSDQRILSIDIFRGVTIFMMVFVNELAGVSGIPPWMKHVPPGADGMTFVDVVFPAFLFIVGMAIPFAVRNRLAKGTGPIHFWKHVLIRTLGLLVLGIYMVNSGEMNPEANLIPKRLWSAALYIAAILIWNRYPKTEHIRKRRGYAGLRWLGVLVLLALYFLYRKGSGDDLGGMTTSWWGILGLIGWAYFLAMVFFMIAQKMDLGISHSAIGTENRPDNRIRSLSVIFALLLAFVLILFSDLSRQFVFLQWFSAQAGHLVHTLIVISGILCALLLARDGNRQKSRHKIRNILVLGLMLATAGYLCEPLGGISKIGATPAWALYSAAICCVVFPLIYFLVDLKGWKNWANFLQPAGENPLLTYILPALFYAIAGYAFIPDVLSQGVPGILYALLFSLFILWLSRILTSLGIRLHL